MPPKQRGQWSEESLLSAVAEIKKGMSIKRAAIKFGIPRGTLQRHARSGNPVKRLGRRSIMTEDQERELSSQILRFSDIGLPLTPKVLRLAVYSFCEENNIKIPSRNNQGPLIGRKWLKLFLNRNPDVAPKTSQDDKPPKLNKAIATNYFNTLKSIMTEIKVMDKPHLIYNMDEKICQLTLQKQPDVVAYNGVKGVRKVSPENSESVKIVSCGNALGQVIPPVILCRGQTDKPQFSDNLPPGSTAFMTAKGNMTCGAFVKWLDHFAQYKPSAKVLLIFDGTKSHLDANIVAAADKHNITLLSLPSNCTHLFRPMEHSLFRLFEYYWNEELIHFFGMNPVRKVTASSFGFILSKVWLRAATPLNVSAGFEATGIYPFNPTVISEIQFASSLSDQPQEICENAIGIEMPTTTAPLPLALYQQFTPDSFEQRCEPSTSAAYLHS